MKIQLNVETGKTGVDVDHVCINDWHLKIVAEVTPEQVSREIMASAALHRIRELEAQADLDGYARRNRFPEVEK